MNSDNLGVGALTLGNMAIIESAARKIGVDPQFKILGWSDPKPVYFERDNIEVIGLRAQDLNPIGGRLHQISKQCDVVFDIGAGDSFSDIYGPGRISKMLLASTIILNADVPLVFSPQTIGPFKNPAIKRMALNIMRRSESVASRDHLSTEFARGMNYTGPLIEATDVALRVPYDQRKDANDGPVKVGINVSGLLFNGGYSGENMFGLKLDYAQTIRRLITYFQERGGCDIHLIGHVLSDAQPIEDDWRVCKKLADDFPGAQVAPVFKDPIEVKSYIAGMDFFVGARMHACIAAFSAGVPVVPMAYSRKFEGFFGALGYNHVADCRNACADEVLLKIRNSFDQREALAKQCKDARTRGLEQLGVYEASVQKVLSSLLKAAA